MLKKAVRKTLERTIARSRLSGNILWQASRSERQVGLREIAMEDLFRKAVLGQFEAAMAMLKQCMDNCPAALWESTVAEMTVRQIAYHTLFFVDVYLSPGEQTFTLRPLHEVGGDETQPVICPGLDQSATIDYLQICLEKLRTTLASETEETLQGESGFSRLRFSRAELHLYNLRHVQHHTGQISAHLRRLDENSRGREALRWIGTGWR
jgi:uncharacterized damage-inducible protein DinB